VARLSSFARTKLAESGDWKVPGTGRQECLPYAGSLGNTPYVGCYYDGGRFSRRVLRRGPAHFHAGGRFWGLAPGPGRLQQRLDAGGERGKQGVANGRISNSMTGSPSSRCTTWRIRDKGALLDAMAGAGNARNYHRLGVKSAAIGDNCGARGRGWNRPWDPPGPCGQALPMGAGPRESSPACE